MSETPGHRPIFYGRRIVGCRCGLTVDDEREFEEHLGDVAEDVAKDY